MFCPMNSLKILFNRFPSFCLSKNLIRTRLNPNLYHTTPRLFHNLQKGFSQAISSCYTIPFQIHISFHDGLADSHRSILIQGKCVIIKTEFCYFKKMFELFNLSNYVFDTSLSEFSFMDGICRAICTLIGTSSTTDDSQCSANMFTSVSLKRQVFVERIGKLVQVILQTAWRVFNDLFISFVIDTLYLINDFSFDQFQHGHFPFTIDQYINIFV